VTEAVKQHKLRGRAQTPEHIAKRAAATRLALSTQVRACVHCSSSFTPTRAAQRYCSLGCWTVLARKKRDQTHRIKVSPTEYRELVAKFGDVCMICAEKPKYKLAVDHCHETGRIRGLLCHRCNTSLGLMRDNPALLERASVYLRSV